VGFSAEDFTAAVRRPSRGLDPFEEEYGRGGVDSAIQEFEKSHPEPTLAEEPSTTANAEAPVSSEQEESGREVPPPWLPEESEEEEAFEVHPEVEALEFEHPPERGLEMSRGEVSREIEALAQKSSIPELTQMLSNVAKSGGNDWSDEQIEKLARRVVEKLSDRVVREIAWEVIPDVAEIVIKRRIKELE